MAKREKSRRASRTKTRTAKLDDNVSSEDGASAIGSEGARAKNERAYEARIKDIYRYLAIADVCKKEKARKPIDICEAVNRAVRNKEATLSEADTEWKCSYDQIRHTCERFQKLLGYDSSLIDLFEDRLTLTPAGEAVWRWARIARRSFDKYGTRKEPYAQLFGIATHHFFEATLLPKVLPKFIHDTERPVHVRITQIDSVYEGINELWDGEVDVVLDGVPSDVTFDGMVRVPLGLKFRQMVLIPKGKNHEFADGPLTLDRIKKEPLVYADMPTDQERRLRTDDSNVSRIRLSTTTSVVKYVEEHGCLGIATNWKTHLGAGLNELFCVRFLEPAFRLDELALFVPSAQDEDRKKVTECFLNHLLTVCGQEQDNDQIINP